MKDLEKIKDRFKNFLFQADSQEAKKFFDDLLAMRPDMTGIVRKELQKLLKQKDS